MGFDSVAAAADSYADGRIWRQHFHKTTTPVLSGSILWLDMSMGAGTPKYNAYVGSQLEFTPMIGSGSAGINTGAAGDKWITKFMMSGSTASSSAFPASVMLLDYVGFYPLVDMDSTDTQTLDNTNYTSRYDSGMRLMIVTTTPQTTGSPVQCVVNYTGSNGVQTTVNFWVNAASSAGSINCFSSATANLGFFSVFVPLGVGTYDVASVQDVTLLNSAGGFCAFVLVKPLLETHIPENATPVELDFPIHRFPPYVPDGAYLNFIACPFGSGSVSSFVRGQLNFIRST